MSAVARFKEVLDLLATDEQDDAYIEAVRECSRNRTRRAREDWLLQEIIAISRRTNIIRAKLTFCVEERLCPEVLKEQLRKETELLEQHNAELQQLRVAA